MYAVTYLVHKYENNSKYVATFDVSLTQNVKKFVNNIIIHARMHVHCTI